MGHPAGAPGRRGDVSPFGLRSRESFDETPGYLGSFRPPPWNGLVIGGWNVGLVKPSMKSLKSVSRSLLVALLVWGLMFLAGLGFVIGFLAGALKRWE